METSTKILLGAGAALGAILLLTRRSSAAQQPMQPAPPLPGVPPLKPPAPPPPAPPPAPKPPSNTSPTVPISPPLTPLPGLPGGLDLPAGPVPSVPSIPSIPIPSVPVPASIGQAYVLYKTNLYTSEPGATASLPAIALANVPEGTIVDILSAGNDYAQVRIHPDANILGLVGWIDWKALDFQKENA